MLKEKFVVDTNVIMVDPYCVNKLKGKVYIPTTVLEELDKHKSDNGEKGRNIREFGRLIDKNMPDNVEFVDSRYSDVEIEMTNDDRIIAVAERYDAILVSNDILMSVKARAVGVSTEKYQPTNIIEDRAFTGLADNRGKDPSNNLFPNEYEISEEGLFVNKIDGKKRLGKDKTVWGISHKNVEQRCALDALMDDRIKLVTISGKAGGGKTLLAIAAGLEKVITENKYTRLLVARPIVPMGNDIGYLPGDVGEKLGPWMQPIFDNIDFLFNTDKTKKGFDSYLELEQNGILKVEALTYIRGRTIPHQFIIIDEAQNLSVHEVKTILTRAGEGTKIILTGDPAQIDNPKVDSENNGLSYTIEKFKDQMIAAHITLIECERSELADIASDIM